MRKTFISIFGLAAFWAIFLPQVAHSGICPTGITTIGTPIEPGSNTFLTPPSFEIPNCVPAEGYSLFYRWKLSSIKDGTQTIIDQKEYGAGSSSYSAPAIGKGAYSVEGGVIECPNPAPSPPDPTYCFAIGGGGRSFAIDRVPTAVITKVSPTCQVNYVLELSCANSIDPDQPEENLGGLGCGWEILSGGESIPPLPSGNFGIGVRDTTVTAKLTVANDYGAKDSTTASFTCEPKTEVSIQASLSSPEVGQTVVFTPNIVGPFSNLAWELYSRPPGSQVVLAVNRSTATLVPDIPGSYSVRVTVHDSGNGVASGTSTVTATAPSSSGPYSFRLEGIEIGQGILHSNEPFRIVGQKPLVIRALVKRLSEIPLNDNRAVPVNVSFQLGGQNFDCKQTFSTNVFFFTQTTVATVPLICGPLPALNVSGNLTIEINPLTGGIAAPVEEIDHLDNVLSKQMDLQSYKGLEVGYYIVKPGCPIGNCFVDVSADLDELKATSNDFVQGMFPVGNVKSPPGFGEIVSRGIPFAGPMIDSLNISQNDFLSPKATTTHVRRKIGIVSVNPPSGQPGDGYFRYYGLNITGRRYKTLSVALVQEDGIRTMAHELAHSLGTVFRPIDHVSCPSEVDGFWAEKGTTGSRHQECWMNAQARGPIADPDVWATDSVTYFKLMDAFVRESSRVPVQANALYLNGILDSEGNFTSNAAFLGSSEIAPDEGGLSGAVQLRGPRGEVLGHAGFDASMVAEDITEAGHVDVPQAEIPIAVVVPLSSLTERVELAVAGKTNVILPHSALLSSAIRQVPNVGLVGNPESARNQLLQICLEIEAHLTAQEFQSAFVLIKDSLKPKIYDLVTNDFEKSSPSEFNRNDVLALADSILPMIEELYEAMPAPKDAILEIKTNKTAYAVGEKSEVSLRARTLPSNKETKFLADLFLNDLPQKVENSKDGSWTAKSSALGSGLNRISAQLYIINKRVYERFSQAIDTFERKNFDLNRRLEGETDPDVRDVILKEISANNNKIHFSREKILTSRVMMGQKVEVLVNAN